MLSSAADLGGAALGLAESPVQTGRLKWNVVAAEGHERVEEQVLQFREVLGGDVLAPLRDHGPVLEAFVLALLPHTLVLEVAQAEHAVSQGRQKLLVDLWQVEQISQGFDRVRGKLSQLETLLSQSVIQRILSGPLTVKCLLLSYLCKEKIKLLEDIVNKKLDVTNSDELFLAETLLIFCHVRLLAGLVLIFGLHPCDLNDLRERRSQFSRLVFKENGSV